MKSAGSARRALLFERLEDRTVMSGIVGVAVAGDDLSTEYANQSYNYATDWVDLLAQNKGVNFGTKGTNGYAFDQATIGATSSQLSQQITAISSETSAKQVSHAVLMVGEQDFSLTSPTPTTSAYSQIYNSLWGSQVVSNYVSTVALQIEQDAQSITFPGADVLIANVPDPGATPAGIAAFPDPAKRALVTAAIQSVNQQLAAFGTTSHFPILDLYGLMQAVVGTASAPVTNQTIGGVQFHNMGGTAGTDLFVADGFHPGTALQAMIANGVSTALDVSYGGSYTQFSEADVVGLAGTTYVSNTLNLNYANYVDLPHAVVYVDFGNGTTTGSFGTRLNELATRLNEANFTANEISTLESSILSGLQKAYSGYLVQFVTTPPTQGSYETLDFGLRTSDVANATQNALGYSPFDWLNQTNTDATYVFPANFYSTATAALSRSTLISTLGNAFAYFGVHEVGYSFGLNRQDSFGDPRITPATYANTQGDQSRDYMNVDETVAFNVVPFEGTPEFAFSQLSEAKLNFGANLVAQQVRTTGESNAAHGSLGTAQTLTPSSLVGVGMSGVKAVDVNSATLQSLSEHDFYAVTLNKGDLLTANVVASGLYGNAPNTFATLLQLHDGTGTVLTTSDGTYLGANSFGAGNSTTKTSSDPFLLNFVAPATGVYYLDLSATAITGKYDLFVATTAANPSPWYNQRNPLDVNDDTVISPGDVLDIVNELNSRTYSAANGLLPTTQPAGTSIPYLDANDDGYVSPVDALLVINELNGVSTAFASPSVASPGIASPANSLATPAFAAADAGLDPIANGPAISTNTASVAPTASPAITSSPSAVASIVPTPTTGGTSPTTSPSIKLPPDVSDALDELLSSFVADVAVQGNPYRIPK